MIVDRSAVLAIICRQPGYEALIAKLSDAEALGIGTSTVAEIGIVLEGDLGLDGRTILDRFLQDFEIVAVPLGRLHWREAVDAYRRFGEDRHRAALSFGDCMSYATARLAERPLLYAGGGFSHADVEGRKAGTGSGWGAGASSCGPSSVPVAGWYGCRRRAASSRSSAGGPPGGRPCARTWSAPGRAGRVILELRAGCRGG